VPPIASFSSGAVRIPVPLPTAAPQPYDLASARMAQEGVREAFLYWFARGYAAVAIEDAGNHANYVLEPPRAESGF
jgi:hypothetical protein